VGHSVSLPRFRPHAFYVNVSDHIGTYETCAYRPTQSTYDGEHDEIPEVSIHISWTSLGCLYLANASGGANMLASGLYTVRQALQGRVPSLSQSHKDAVTVLENDDRM
jgi:hypothetical protein